MLCSIALAERWDRLAKFPLPAIDAASLVSLMRWLMALIVLAVVRGTAQGRFSARFSGAVRRADDSFEEDIQA